MVDSQVRTSDVTSYAVIGAMAQCPRELFVPEDWQGLAYAETEIPLAEGRAMMTPRSLAKMLDTAAIGPDELVLEIAPGTGYSTALIARLAATVIAIEPEEALAESARRTLTGLEIYNAVVNEGALTEGDPKHAPYDAIFINGAVEQVPSALTDQLKDGGRLIAIFMEEGVGQCRTLLRVGDTLAEQITHDIYGPILPGFERERSFAF